MVAGPVGSYGRNMIANQPVLQPPTPLQIAPDTFLLRSIRPMVGAPLCMYTNALLIRAAQPVIVDSAPRGDERRWLGDLAELISLSEVRWVFLSHDSDQRIGSVRLLLERCPAAVVVTSWAGCQRAGGALDLAPQRLRWVDDGGVLDIGDRALRVLMPPVYDSPASRALFDPSTGVLWASSMFACPVAPPGVERVDELPLRMWSEGMAMFHHHALAPWLATVDRAAHLAATDRMQDLKPKVIVGAHTPVIAGASVGMAFDQLAGLPSALPPPHPAIPRRGVLAREPPPTG
jgi:flavorubredoxin